MEDMEIFRKELDVLEKMSDSELKKFTEQVLLEEKLNEILMLILDEYVDEEYDTNKYAILSKEIINKIQASVCEKADGIDYVDLSNDCQIDVLEKLIPKEMEDRKELIESILNNTEEYKTTFSLENKDGKKILRTRKEIK